MHLAVLVSLLRAGASLNALPCLLQEFERARSVYERALDVDYKHIPTWQRYATMEMRNKFVNRARNVWDRAITLLPRVDQMWCVCRVGVGCRLLVGRCLFAHCVCGAVQAQVHLHGRACARPRVPQRPGCV